MLFNSKQFVDEALLERYNEKLNLRNRNRLKYKGELILDSENRTDWQDLGLAGCSVGDIYKLTGDVGEQLILDGITYDAGMWIIVETYGQPNEDGTRVLDRDGNDVTIEVEILSNPDRNFIYVDELPDDDIDDNTFYVLKNEGDVATNIKYYRILTEGYGVVDGGISNGITTYTFEQVAEDFDTFKTTLGLVQIEEDLYNVQNLDIVYYEVQTNPFIAKKFGFVKPNEHLNEIYLYDKTIESFNKVYPSDSIIDIDNFSVPYKEQNKIYRYAKKTMNETDVVFYEIADADYYAGQDGVHLTADDTLDASYATIASDMDTYTTKYTLNIVAALGNTSRGFVTYVVDSVSKISAAIDFKPTYSSGGQELYFYNKSTDTLDKIYPIEGASDVVTLVEVTKAEYEKIINGTSTEHTYSKYAIYVCIDTLETSPEAYIEKQNIFAADAIKDVAILPTENINNKIFYRTETEVEDYTNLSYMDVTESGYTVTTDGVTDGSAVIPFDQIYKHLNTYIEAFGLVATTASAAGASTIIFFKFKGVGGCMDFASFEMTTSIETGIHIYSESTSEWLDIYPTPVVIEDEDIDFEDPDVWYPQR